MITNKDIRVENGFLIINGDKYPLDGQSPETIMEIVEDNSDTTPTENSTAPVTSGGVYTALGTKQDTLTFDSAPTDASTNPVTSGGLYNTIGDLTQTGVTGASVAAQLGTLGTALDGLKIATFAIPLNNIDIDNAWGSFYMSDVLEINYTALGLTNPPKHVSISVSSNSTIIVGMSYITAAKAEYRLIRAASSTGLTVNVSALIVY